MEDKKNSNSFFDTKTDSGIIALIVFILIIVWGYTFGTKRKKDTLQKKLKKQDIANEYGVCRKTLRKWIKYCCPSINYEKYYLPRRKFSFEEVKRIKSELGSVNENKPLTKKEIIEETGCQTYAILKKAVLNSIDKIGLTEEAYSNMDIFPPNTAKKIINFI